MGLNDPDLDPHEMWERVFRRPRDYFRLPAETQWEIDRKLGLLDYAFTIHSPHAQERFDAHFAPVTSFEEAGAATNREVKAMVRELMERRAVDVAELARRAFIGPAALEEMLAPSGEIPIGALGQMMHAFDCHLDVRLVDRP